MGGNLEHAAEMEAVGKYNLIIKNIKKKKAEKLFTILDTANDFVNSFDEHSLLTLSQHTDLSELKLMLDGLGFEVKNY